MKTDRLRRKWRRFVGWLRVLPITLAGCWSQVRTADEEAARQVCLVTVEVEMDRLAEELCPTSGPQAVAWDQCAHRDMIMAELQLRQGRCSGR